MPEKKSGAEPLKENERPINQLCKKALSKAGQSPDPSGLYWVQLADWALSSPEGPEAGSDFLELLDLLRGQKPEVMQAWLERGLSKDEEEEQICPPEKENDPLALARACLEKLEAHLTEAMSDYPEQPLSVLMP
jgi:hypothetical protein